MDVILNAAQYSRVLDGVMLTLQVLGISFALGIVLSLLVGVARLSERTWVRGAALVFVEIARGMSSIVLLFVMAIAVPILLGFEQGSLLALGSIALGINMGGYGAEIIRGAILSVPKGQTEASIALNLTNTQRLRFIILPQAMRVILPPMGNLTIEILKGTALVALIGLADLTFVIRQIDQFQSIAETPVSTPLLLLNALVIYFVLSQIIAALYRVAERYIERKYEGGPTKKLPMDFQFGGAGVAE